MLRNYQKETIEKMAWSLGLEGNSVVVIPTGGGKTHIISGFVDRTQKPVLILVPSKELLEQDYEKLSHVVSKEDIGVFSASMNSKEVRKYTLATIQSAYKVPEKFAHYEVVIIDECDLLNPKKLQGMYNRFFRAIGNPKVIGLTATPFRMDSFYRPIPHGWGYNKYETVHTLKMITRYRDRFWHRVLHVVQVQDLLKDGYLCPLTYHNYTMIPQTKLFFNKSKSDFNLENFEDQFNPFLYKTKNLIEEIPSSSVLVFCATVTQAESLQRLIKNAEIVTGKTPKRKREQIVEDFRAGKLRVILNVGVLLVGFDKPDLGAIVIARPTKSLRLHSQLLGRGMRTFEGKETCHIYDLVGNVKGLGRAETMRIEKINGQWNVTTESRPTGFHMVELYAHVIAPKREEETIGGW